MTKSQKRFRSPASRWVAAALVSTAGLSVTPSIADEPIGNPLECYNASGAVIFTSETADIALFDPAAHNVSLVATIPVPGQNATIYEYGPTNIMCVLVTD